MKRALRFVAAVLLASGVAFGQSSIAPVVPAAKPGALPAGVLAVVEFGSIEAFQKHVTDFVTATTALPPASIPSVVEIFGGPLHSNDPSQMDVTQPARFILVKAGPRKVEMVLQCSVKDAAAYRTTLQPGLTKGEEKDGVTTYTADEETVAVGDSGKMICVGENAAAVAQVLTLVKSGAIPRAAMLKGGDVAAGIEVKSLIAHMADEKGVLFGDLKESLKKALSESPNGAEQAQKAQRMVEAELDALETVLKQLERATVTLTPDAQELKLSLKVAPIQGSLLGQYLATVPHGIPATLKYMPEDAFAVCAFKLGNLEMLTLPLIAFNAKVMAESGMDPVQAGLMAGQFSGCLKALGDEMTFAIRSGQGIRTVSAAALKDPEALKAFLQKTPELFASLGGFYKSMGMPVQTQSEVIKYNDHDVTRLKLTFDAKPAAGGAPEQAGMAEAQQKAMQVMFGDAFTTDVVILGKDVVSAAGSDSLDTLKQIMDGKLKKLADRDDFKATVAAIPADSCGFCLVHLTDLAEFGISMARAIGQMPIPPIRFPNGPGVKAVFVTAPGGSSVVCNVHIPAAEIKAIADGIKTLTQPPPGPGMEPPAVPPSTDK